jgi:HSP20 family protein
MPVRDQLTIAENVGSSPAGEFNRVTQQLSGLFGEHWPALSAVLNNDDFTPVSDIEETDDAYLVEIELPGVTKDDIVIDVDRQQLTVSGDRPEPDRGGILRHRARCWGRFRYEVRLPEPLNAKASHAMLADGVLRVHIPKSRAAQHRHVAVR